MEEGVVMTDYKTEIIGLLKSVDRENIPSLIEWIEKSDFFTAPASTRFHGSYSGGLAEHSLNVYDCLVDLLKTATFLKIRFDRESIIICGLLHDLCKTNFYKESKRSKKDESGKWVEVPYYEVDDKEPYGHGEKSVMLIEKFIKLTNEECYSIRWHMGGFDESVKGGSYSIGKSYEKYPLAVALHLADMMATYIIEKEKTK
jgi:hypothetical protein